MHQGNLSARSSAKAAGSRYLPEVMAGASLDFWLVHLGWATPVVTGGVAKVGQVFVSSMPIILFGLRIAGIIVDRMNHRRNIWLGHLAIEMKLKMAARTLRLSPFDNGGLPIQKG